MFARGFLPSSRELDRFYMFRQLRVALKNFKVSSENRRVLRKGAGIKIDIVRRERCDDTNQRRDFCTRYADARFGNEVMSAERLDSLFNSKITSHLLVFTEEASGAELG